MIVRPSAMLKQLQGAALIALLFCTGQAYCQFDFTKNVNLGNLRIFNGFEYEKPPFKWKMSGHLQTLINEGLNSIDEGAWPNALLNFEKAVQEDSTLFIAYYYRGVCYKTFGVFAAANWNFGKASQLNPTQPEPLLEIAKMLQVTGKLRVARNAYHDIINRYPAYVSAYWALGVLEYEDGKSDLAHANFLKCLEIDSSYTPAMAGEAVLQFRHYDGLPKAIDMFTKAIKMDSTHFDSYYWRGMAYLVQEEPNLTLSDWTRCLQIRPNRADVRKMRAALYVKLRMYDEAFSDLRKASVQRTFNNSYATGTSNELWSNQELEEATSYVTSQVYGLQEKALSELKKGFCILWTGGGDAVESLNASINIEPSASAYYLVGLTHDFKNSFPQALENYMRALDLDKDIFGIHHRLALYYTKAESWDKVSSECAEMLRLRPGFPDAYKLMATSTLQTDDLAGATLALNEYIKYDSSSVTNIATLAECANKSGNYDVSNKAVARVLRYNPNNLAMLDLLAKNYVGLQDTVEAILVYKRFTDCVLPLCYLGYARMSFLKRDWAEFELALKKFKGTTGAHTGMMSEAECLRGRAKIQQGKVKDAVLFFDKAIRIWPTNAEARYYLALSYRDLGKRAEARKELPFLVKISYPGAKNLMDELSK